MQSDRMPQNSHTSRRARHRVLKAVKQKQGQRKFLSGLPSPPLLYSRNIPLPKRNKDRSLLKRDFRSTFKHISKEQSTSSLHIGSININGLNDQAAWALENLVIDRGVQIMLG